MKRTASGAHPRDAAQKRCARRLRGNCRRSLLVLLVLIAVPAAIWWPTVVAQLHAVAIVATLLEVPVLEPVVSALTRDAVHEDVRLDGHPTRVFRPRGDGPWPAVVFVTGADAAGRESEDIVGLGNALARAGYVTIVPDLPGLTDGAVSTRTLDATGAAVVAASRLDVVEGERVAVVSVSAGASLAILAASDPQVSERVSVVAGVAPFARVRTVLEIAVTGGYTKGDGDFERYETEGWLRTAAIASLRETSDGSPGARLGIERLLKAGTPAQFSSRFEALPAPTRESISGLSPLDRVDGLDAPLELASSERDRYFPLEESRLLAAHAPQGRLTVTGVLEHASPRPGLGDTRDLLAFNGFVVRVLRLANDRAER